MGAIKDMPDGKTKKFKSLLKVFKCGNFPAVKGFLDSINDSAWTNVKETPAWRSLISQIQKAEVQLGLESDVAEDIETSQDGTVWVYTKFAKTVNPDGTCTFDCGVYFLEAPIQLELAQVLGVMINEGN